MKQVEAVFQAVCAIRGVEGFDEKVVLTKEEKSKVIEMVTRGLMSGDVDFKPESRAKHNTYELVKKYTGGLVDNHLRKDKRLNGDTEYVAKNPGSRTGSQDSVLKNLKLLKSTVKDAESIAAIDEEIAKRLEAIGKPKTVTIDISKIPEELRHLIPSAS